jgi:hypothetical protein
MQAPVQRAAVRTQLAAGKVSPSAPIVAAPSAEVPTVEIIRGDKRTHESVRQE